MRQEIEALREKLNKLLETEPLSSFLVLELSKTLDKLIIDYYRSQKPVNVKK